MGSSGKCRICGSQLSAKAATSICPACQLESLFELDEFDDPTEEKLVASPASDLPSIHGLELIERVGEGGMGVVYRARRSIGPDQSLAVKVMRFSGLNQEQASLRFQEEITALATIQHPYVARYIDSGLTGAGEPYCLLEWIDGVTLRHFLLSKKEELTMSERLDLAEKICASVNACHELGIIHRDLHPDNILVTENQEPKLVDFGISKILESKSTVRPTTRSGAVIGHPEYLSPEQIEQNTIGPATDVFVLGILLCELLGGTHPFIESGGKQIENFRAIQEKEPQLPKEAKFPHDLPAVLNKALEKKSENRYRNAGELADDLERAIAGTPVIARPLTATYVFACHFKRHRKLFLSFFGFIVLLGAFVAYAFKREADIVRNEQLREGRLAASSARVAGQRGEWFRALELSKEALAKGYAPQRSRLAIVEAAASSSRLKLARETLTELSKERLGPKELALYNYWKAFLLTGSNQLDEAKSLIQEAVSSGQLPPQKELIGRAALTEDTTESLALLNEGLIEDPFDRQALLLRCLQTHQINEEENSLETIETALRFFPRDRELLTFYTFALARAGQVEKARKIVESDPEFEDLGRLIDGLAITVPYYEAVWQTEAAPSMWQLTTLLGKTALAYGQFRKTEGVSPLFIDILLRHSLLDAKALKAVLFNTNNFQKLEEQLDEFRKSPEGERSHLAATLANGCCLASVIDEATREEFFVRHFAICDELIETSPSLQLKALNLEIAGTYYHLHDFHSDNEESRQASLALIRRRLALPLPIATVPLVVFVRGAAATDDLELRNTLVEMLIERDPNNPSNRFSLCKVDSLIGKEARALREVDKLLREEELNEEEHQQAEELRVELRAKLQELLAVPE